MPSSLKVVIGTVASLLSASLCALGQAPGTLAGPRLGWVVEDGVRLRPIQGVTGAATLGIAAILPADLSNFALSPKQDYALAVRGGDSAVVLVRRPFDAQAATALAGALAHPAKIALSPGGSVCALLAADASVAQVWTGLPDAPTMAWQADVTSAALGTAILAVNDDGSAVLGVNSAAAGDSVILIRAGASAVTVASASKIAGLVFIPGGGDALLADQAANQVIRLQDVTGSAAPSVLADASAGVASPAALALSSDGTSAYVANTAPGGVLAIDLSGKPPTAIPCACTPTQITPIGGGAYHLTGSGQSTWWIFDASSQNRRIFFVPPDPAQASNATPGGQQ